MTNLIGQTLGQYEIIDTLGAGGMATVYRARQRSIKRDVAVKILAPELSTNPTVVERFMREVKLIAEMQHARILPIYDFGKLDGIMYIVIAYMPGGTLADRIQQAPLSLTETVIATRQIAEGLDFLHQNGVIHRDLKPSNILLDATGSLYLGDLGIAKISDATLNLTGGSIIGTPAYMAPELYERGETTPAADIYALGASICVMLAQRPPYLGEPYKVMRSHLYDPVPDIRQWRPDVPDSVQRVIRTAMAKNPAKRYPSSGALADALERAIDDPSGDPHPYDLANPAEADTPTIVAGFNAPTLNVGMSHTGPTRRGSASRTPARMALYGVGILAALLTIGGGAWFFGGRNQSTTPPVTTSEPTESADSADLTETPEPPTQVATKPVKESTSVPTVASTLRDRPAYVGFNANGQGYIVDANCITSPSTGCSSSPFALAADGSAIQFGQWSPDGSHIAFAASNTLNIATNHGDASETWEILSLGDLAASDVAWSPDGSRLAYIRTQQESGLGTIASIWTLDTACLSAGDCAAASTQITHESTNASRPIWSPDGSQLAYLLRQSSGRDLGFLIDALVGGTSSRITAAAATSVSQMAWLPDGRMLFTNDAIAGGTGNTIFHDVGINVLNLTSGDYERILTMSEGNFGTECANGVCTGGGIFALSPDGAMLAISYAPDATKDTEIYVLDLACLTSDPAGCEDQLVQLTNNTTDDLTPAWSSDGTWIAFVGARATNLETALDVLGISARNTGTDLYLIKPDGSGLIALTSMGFVDAYPLAWQP